MNKPTFYRIHLAMAALCGLLLQGVVFSQSPADQTFLVTTNSNCKLYFNANIVQTQIHRVSGQCGPSGFYNAALVFGATSVIDRPNNAGPISITGIVIGFASEGHVTGLRMTAGLTNALVIVNPVTKASKSFNRKQAGYSLAKVKAAIDELAPNSGSQNVSGLTDFLKSIAEIWDEDDVGFGKEYTQGSASPVLRNPNPISASAAPIDKGTVGSNVDRLVGKVGSGKPATTQDAPKVFGGGGRP